MHFQFKTKFPVRGFVDETIIATKRALNVFAETMMPLIQDKIQVQRQPANVQDRIVIQDWMVCEIDVHILTLDDINRLLDWCDKHDCLNLTDDLIKQILEE